MTLSLLCNSSENTFDNVPIASLLSDHTKIYIINVERTDFFLERTDYFWNNPTWNDLTMERNDRKPTDRMRVMNKL